MLLFIEKFPCSICERIILNNDIYNKDHNYKYSLVPVTDYVCFTQFKNRGKLKFVSMFIFDIILFTEKCYQAYFSNMKSNNLKKIPSYLEIHEMKIVKFITSYY